MLPDSISLPHILPVLTHTLSSGTQGATLWQPREKPRRHHISFNIKNHNLEIIHKKCKVLKSKELLLSTWTIERQEAKPVNPFKVTAIQGRSMQFLFKAFFVLDFSGPHCPLPSCLCCSALSPMSRNMASNSSVWICILLYSGDGQGRQCYLIRGTDVSPQGTAPPKVLILCYGLCIK